jgi:hypothetical protein
MRTVRVSVDDAGDPGGPGRRRIGLWLLTALALPILITAGVGYGVSSSSRSTRRRSTD